MSKRMIGAAWPAVLGILGVAMSQSHDPAVWYGNRRNPPLTPEGKAILARKNRLTADAAAALDAGRYEEAEAAARQAMSLASDSGVNQEVLASALEAQGRTEEALWAYQQMADQGSQHSRVLLPYALLLLRAGRWAQAVEAYNKQLPYLGDVLLVGGKQALTSTYGPFSPDVPQPRELETAIHIALGITYSCTPTWGRKSQRDRALSQYEQALALEPTSALIHLYYGHGLRELGRREEAQAVFKKASEMARGDVKITAEKAFSGQA